MAHPPKLIQANIALFAGDYAETRRLLNDFRSGSGGITPEDVPLVLWLDAQTQDDAGERLRHLRSLLAQVPSENAYAVMARRVLADEDDHAERMRAARKTAIFPNLKLWQGVALAAAVLTVVLLLLLSGAPPTEPDARPTVTASAAVQPTVSLVDNSLPLDPAAHMGRYPQGILQLTRVENASLRVIDLQTAALISPVDGARFYALQVGFECRSGVCDQPPEAHLALQLDDGTQTSPRTDLTIAGAEVLTPVALGRTTRGWIVFEIPLISDAIALIISARDNQAFDPISILLRG